MEIKCTRGSREKIKLKRSKHQLQSNISNIKNYFSEAQAILLVRTFFDNYLAAPQPTLRYYQRTAPLTRC